MNDNERLPNDCFALPRGITWTPVDQALEQLKNGLITLKQSERVTVSFCVGRVLANSVYAKINNPPFTNSAVDGYGFCGPATDDVNRLKLLSGVAAAGNPFKGTVSEGSAVKVLTGAVLPDGVDTVLLEEDVQSKGQESISFIGPLKVGANTRNSGEDVSVGERLFPAGHKIRPQDLALLIATGVANVEVYSVLKVGILSTGSELLDEGLYYLDQEKKGKVFDSNRPMLLSLVKGWGFKGFDLGVIPDDKRILRAKLNNASSEVDVIISSGGASSGDQDHISQLIQSEGKLENWRIAIKPGRPLALGLWNDTPIFGLPGNPVAAFVCALIFARPALGILSGCGWANPVGYNVESSFNKKKKPGRREYLRARINKDGKAEIFSSEGSGKISSLSWSSGLLELLEHEEKVSKGQLVRYIPYSSFEL
ncbi:MAG: molybdopterin molybdenumtransferase MoeA [Rhodobacteraceae bacterium]|nr:MAG: molybdopterin molybdenumtransferase MoeA [Paracoccaceae bacterium]